MVTVRAKLGYYKKKDGTSPIVIYVYSYTERKKHYINTGLSVQKDQWSERLGQVKKSHPLSKKMNRIVNGHIIQTQAKMMDGCSVSDLREGRVDKTDLVAYLEKYMSNNEVLKPGTLKKYRTTLRRLKDFLFSRSRERLPFSEITPTWAHEFLDFLSGEGVGPHGKRNMFNVIKKVMGVAYKDGTHQNQDYERIRIDRPKSPKKIYLTEDEMEAIYQLDLSSNLSLERYRDCFYVQFQLFMRHCDVARIERSMMIEVKGKRYIRFESQKTDVTAVVPLSDRAYRILEKYNWNVKTCNQILNKEIKRIAAMAGVNDVVREGKKSGTKSSFVCTHTARRSAATIAHLNGMRLKTIADLGGWKKLSTLEVYLRASVMTTAENVSDHSFFKR
ncbi:phage integrase SAM-like domain-containing protein [Phaeodactylibacter xiamenensis]|uniref:phage integrase SAM-like domain-containing protein n=1 Tax=Phaeodactylibacter xiamenensis TaxID=1524460 RepID=UPI003CCC293C